MNECGGRTVKIFDTMSAQVAYVMAIYRHRPQTIAALERMVGGSTRRRVRRRWARWVAGAASSARASSARSASATTWISTARRSSKTPPSATASASASMSKPTTRSRPKGPSSTTARSSSAVSSARAAGWTKGLHGRRIALLRQFALRERRGRLDLRSPYTVSHHKSSLLIAGMFSFFNAGSGSNQSNHLFKSGAVHPGGASEGLQVRLERLHHVAGPRRGLHDGHGTPLLPPRHLGVPPIRT